MLSNDYMQESDEGGEYEEEKEVVVISSPKVHESKLNMR